MKTSEEASGQAAPEAPLRGWHRIGRHLAPTLGSKSAPHLRKLQRQEGLPVFKLGKGPQGRVAAYPSELDEWVRDYLSRRAGETAQRSRLPERNVVAHSQKRRVRRLWIPAIAIGVAGIAVLSFLLVGHDSNPANPRYRVEENSLIAIDPKGTVLWELDPNPDRDLTETAPDRISLLRADLDNDGTEDVLLNFNPADTSRGPGHLVAVVSNGEALWRFQYGRLLRVGSRDFGEAFGDARVILLSAASGGSILVLARHHSHYPMQVALLNFDGELLAEYWHPGWLYSVALVDVDNDGEDELLLGGTNNPNAGNGHPALVVLEIPFERQPVCATSANFFGSQNCLEADYLLFPLPDVFDATGTGGKISKISQQQSNRILLELSSGRELGVAVFYHLTQALEPIEVWPSDLIKARHAELFEHELLDHHLTENEIASWIDYQRFSTAPDANSASIDDLF